MSEPSWTERMLAAAGAPQAAGESCLLWSVIAHDLRAPLAAIQGYAGLLAGGKAGPLNARQQEFVAGVADELQALHQRLECVLAACRLLQAMPPAAGRPGDLGELVAAIERPFAAVATAGGVALACAVDQARQRATVQLRGGCEAAEADLDAVLIAIGLEVERLGGRQVLLARDAGLRYLELSLPGRDADPDPVK
jgi:signal transduction histidine kinase